MAKEDEVLARYLSDNERYADLINGVTFGGRQVVLAENLSDRDTKTGYHKEGQAVKGKSNTKYRDLFRTATFGANFAVVGVENQKQVHYLMPLRCMEYDIKEYQRQELEQNREQGKLTGAEFLSDFSREGRLNPCITIVLYYGDDWDGSTDLYGLLNFNNIPDELKKMVNNYRMNLLDIGKLESTDVFHTDIKQVFDFIRNKKNKTEIVNLIKNNPAYRKMPRDAYDVMVAFTKSETLLPVWENKDEESVDMCKALEDLKEEGREEGRDTVLCALVQEGLLAMEIAAQKAQVSLKKFETIYLEYQQKTACF